MTLTEKVKARHKLGMRRTMLVRHFFKTVSMRFGRTFHVLLYIR